MYRDGANDFPCRTSHRNTPILVLTSKTIVRKKKKKNVGSLQGPDKLPHRTVGDMTGKAGRGLSCSRFVLPRSYHLMAHFDWLWSDRSLSEASPATLPASHSIGLSVHFRSQTEHREMRITRKSRNIPSSFPYPFLLGARCPPAYARPFI